MKLKSIFYTMLTGLSLLSCKREFDSNADFTNDAQVVVSGDNALLFSRIFRFPEGNAYLWFDIRNEIANFSSPFLGLEFEHNGIARYKRIDLRGRLYTYDREAGQLTILNYPLDIAPNQDFQADLVFYFGRKQPEGCELIADPAKRNECERTFTLSLKEVVFTSNKQVAAPGQTIDYNGTALKFTKLNQELYLTN